MAGHSKWANIKRRKGAQDAKRGRIFTRLIRELVTAASAGGPDPDGNARLRLALDRARAANMPKDTISRAVARGAGGGAGERYEKVLYEGYGPAGVALLVEGLTDNRNRTVSEVRHIFTQAGGKLGDPGCVAYLFELKGLLGFDAAKADADALFEAALEAGALDLREGDPLTVVTAPADFEAVRDALAAAGFAPSRAELSMEAASSVELRGGDAEKMLRMLDALEELDDVQAVYANFDIPDEVLEQLA